ncbi:MAG TPA: hypothetical protein VMZ00_09440 [Sporichthya sp.]|nr:hypothetical protein [Sporichthya sp.]
MSGLPDWELREAPDPPFDIVAHWEDDKLIITVAASLTGLAREDAIDTLLNHHRPRRDWRSVFPIPALIALWEWTHRTVQAHERAASAAAGTAATIIVGATALTMTGALDGDERRTPYAAPPPTVITMTVDPTHTELSSTSRPATPRPTRRHTPPPAVVETRRPAATPPPTRAAAAEPTRRPRRTPPASTQPTQTRPEPSATPTGRQPDQQQPETVAATGPTRRTEPPTVDARPATPAPEPGPTMAAAGCGGIHARVDPLLDVCVRL